jgi:hypothetical protein
MPSSGETDQPHADQPAKPKPDPKHPLEYAIFFFVVATAAATATAAYYTRNQWFTAQDQLGVAQDTERRQLRAYLYVDHGPITVTDSTASAEIMIHHAGQTPAYKLKLVGDIEVGHFPLPDTEKLTLPTMGIPIYEFAAIYGNDSITQRISMPMNSNDAIEIQKRSRDRLSGGLQVFYLHGIVRYLDIFGREWPYEFCFSFDPVNPQGSERGCEKYNKPG